MTYPPYQPFPPPPPIPPPAPVAAEGWQVVVEFFFFAQIGSTIYASHAEAVAAARLAAFNFKVDVPGGERARRVYEDGASGFLAMVQGGSRDVVPVRTRVVRWMSEADPR